jgi:hypothetical protein
MGALGGALPLALGGDADVISTAQQRLRALVYAQFVASNWAVPTANAIGAMLGSFQAVAQAVALLWRIDPVIDESDITHPLWGVGRGVQLDRIGRLLNQGRGAASDEEYRPILRARVRANKSNGSGADVIEVFLAMFAGAGAPTITPGWVAAFTIRLVGVIMDPLVVPAALGLLRAAALAGVRAVLEWTTVADSGRLSCDDLTPSATPCPTGIAAVLGDGSVTGGKMGGAGST